MTIWTYQANPAANLSPAAVATIFAAGQFDPPRDLAECWGRSLAGDEWRGEFRLKGDDRIYSLWRVWDEWTVAAMEQERGDQSTPGGQGG